MLERLAFLGKRWQYIIYSEQLVSGTTYFLRQVLALYSLCGAACCKSGLLSLASGHIGFCGAVFGCCACLLRQAKLFFPLWSRMLLILLAFYGSLCLCNLLVEQFFDRTPCLSLSVEEVFTLWSSLSLESTTFSGKRWCCVYFGEQIVARSTWFLQLA